jgi:hypothetical protein
LRHVVIAGHAENGEPERRKQVAAMRVCPGGVVLDDVAGQGDEVRREVALAVMREDRPQRFVGYGAAQGAVPFGEQMRVRQVQDPHRIR